MLLVDLQLPRSFCFLINNLAYLTFECEQELTSYSTDERDEVFLTVCEWECEVLSVSSMSITATPVGNPQEMNKNFVGLPDSST